MSTKHITGNVGLYLTCYKLSKLGWNAMPTARNARGIDIVAYDRRASHFIGVQVKTVSKRSPIGLGKDLDNIAGDFWVIVARAADEPTSFVMFPEEVKRLAHRGEKDGRVSFWLQPNAYDVEDFRERWDRFG